MSEREKPVHELEYKWWRIGLLDALENDPVARFLAHPQKRSLIVGVTGKARVTYRKPPRRGYYTAKGDSAKEACSIALADMATGSTVLQ